MNVSDMPEEMEGDGELSCLLLMTAFERGNAFDEATMFKMIATAEELCSHSSRKVLILIISYGPMQKISNNKLIDIVNNCKCLGINIDQNLSWKTHTSKIHFTACDLCLQRPLNNLLSRHSANSLIWYPYRRKSSKHLADVNKIHIKAARCAS